MSDIVIKVENISKQYRLGKVGTGTLAHDLNRTWHRVIGKEDPYLKIGEANDRTVKGNSEYVWALQDINFDVKQGEILGIIGRNGAGKSTLLKILSRTTTPTTGEIKIKGRVASLLEVGTGFHPELSGRENIFLNGAILGMTKQEIKNKFDEIVDFAGVERYIDTPVKRYSSGMYVRLAFGVAAHLESEILIIDEVLAVGDAEFQKKCLGKMRDISSSEGRTVLFVSHNLTAIKNICLNAILLKRGELVFSGDCETVINSYLESTNLVYSKIFKEDKNKIVKIHKLEILDEHRYPVNRDIQTSENFFIRVVYDINAKIKGIHTTMRLNIDEGETLLATSDSDMNPDILFTERQPGQYVSEVPIPKNLLGENTYSITCSVGIPFQMNFDVEWNALKFKLIEKNNSENIHFKKPGYLSVKIPWKVI